MDVRKLQTSVGVNPDGDAGLKTFTALFQKCGATIDRAQELAICANRYFPEYGIMDSPLRLAHFLGQVLHESMGFRYMEEIASGQAYEGRADLGNTQPGDGIRYKGRGPIQITGRANYRKYGALLGTDFERHPEILSFPSIGLHGALEFWKQNKLNALADADDVLAITKKVNGGTNGLDDRKAQLAKVKGWIL
ncbi:glycoside hydrolase family 19 protein [Novosphingobium sp. BL-8A]|uniref:glycoside hydrolase family 19 protein n=1 Tax=Novosphingobium sp. BL-8A TaxID=3127639 RepID=UPI0037577452